MTRWRDRCIVALFLISCIVLSSGAQQAAIESRNVICPFDYVPHSLDDIKSGAKKPYLFGGIFDSGRNCVNCKRGGLWPSFCGFKHTGKVPFWDNQVCNNTTVEAIIKHTLQQNNAGLLQMTPCELWPYLRGRTTWIVGDSMAKDLYKAVKCFMFEFSDLKSYHASNNYTAMHLLGNIPGSGEPHCVHMPDNTRVCQVHAIQGDLFIEGNRTTSGVLPVIHESLANPQDLFIVNFGLWHGETRQPQYVTNLHQLGKYYAATKGKYPHFLWMETPKQHFDSADGDYKASWIGKRKGPWRCQPIKGVSMDEDGLLHADKGDAMAEYVVEGSWRNILARDILHKQYGVPMLSVYNSTATAWEFHRLNTEGQECSHYCHPSIPQLWVWTLKSTLQQLSIQPVKDWKKAKTKAGCAAVLERDEAQLGAPKPVYQMLTGHQQRAGLLKWLLGGQKFEVQDGVAVFRTSTNGPASYPHTSTLNPWHEIAKLLGQQQQQDEQQREHTSQQWQQQRQQQQRRQHRRQDAD